MRIKTLADANAVLAPYAPLAAQLTGKDITLERMRPLMAVMGNPQDKLRIIHIAGTSGKTSTAYFMAALLTSAGQKTGLTVSPYIDSLAEIVQINMAPLSEAEFCHELEEFMQIVEVSGLKPSYFELVCAFAYWEFARQGVDYAVVETGLGGLQDATNIAGRNDKICVITDIGFDHMGILGNTLTAIAAQKLGIVHEHNTIFMYEQAPQVMAVARETAGRQAADLHIIMPGAVADTSVLPAFQRRNWSLAKAVYDHLANTEELPYLTRQVLAKTQQVQVPARMEAKQIKDKTLVMDGAHNLQKMTAFTDSFKKRYPGEKPAVLLAVKDDKDYTQIVPLIADLAARVIVTEFAIKQELNIRSLSCELLAEDLKKARAQYVSAIPNAHKAFKALIDSPENTLVITGSFYLLRLLRDNEQLV